MYGTEWAYKLVPTLARKKFVHQRTIIVAQRDPAPNLVQYLRQFSVLIIGHFVRVCLRITPCHMYIGRVAVEQRLL